MSEKSEALRLADEIDTEELNMDRLEEWLEQAAAELRRLHDEVESLRQAYNIVTDDCRNLTEKVIPNIRAQRDALLEALKEIVAATDSDEWNPVSTWRARAAIKSVEEGK